MAPKRALERGRIKRKVVRPRKAPAGVPGRMSYSRLQARTGTTGKTFADQRPDGHRRLFILALTVALLLCQPPAARPQSRQAEASHATDEDVISVTTRLVGVTVELADGTLDDSDLLALDINADGVRHRPACAEVSGG